ncbi:MAG: hypothetical protein OEY59_04480 [Deltaproteobacteria bacterium]|nr:hypothetical protein [Deltaproteobacteria bacterium]
MSGPKELKIKRELTYREVTRLSDRLTSIAQRNNYQIVGQPRKDMDTLHLQAVHRFRGTKLSLHTRRKETTMGIVIEDSDSCSDLMNEVVDALNEECPDIVDKWTRVEKEMKKTADIAPPKEAAKKNIGK